MATKDANINRNQENAGGQDDNSLFDALLDDTPMVPKKSPARGRKLHSEEDGTDIIDDLSSSDSAHVKTSPGSGDDDSQDDLFNSQDEEKAKEIQDAIAAKERRRKEREESERKERELHELQREAEEKELQREELERNNIQKEPPAASSDNPKKTSVMELPRRTIVGELWKELKDAAIWDSPLGMRLRKSLSADNEPPAVETANLPDPSGIFGDIINSLDSDDSDSRQEPSEMTETLKGSEADFWFAEGDAELQFAIRALNVKLSMTQIPNEKIAFLFYASDNNKQKYKVMELDGVVPRNCVEGDLSEELNSNSAKHRVITIPSTILKNNQQILLCKIDTRYTSLGHNTLECMKFWDFFSCDSGRHVFFMSPSPAFMSLRQSEWWDEMAKNGRFHIVMTDAAKQKTMATDAYGSFAGSVINFSRHRHIFYPSAWRYAIAQSNKAAGLVSSIRVISEEQLPEILLSQRNEAELGLLRACNISSLASSNDGSNAVRHSAVNAEILHTSLRMVLMEAYFKVLEALMDAYSAPSKDVFPSNVIELEKLVNDIIERLLDGSKDVQDFASAPQQELLDPWSALVQIARLVICYKCASATAEAFDSSIQSLIRHIQNAAQTTDNRIMELYRKASEFVSIDSMLDTPLSIFKEECDMLNELDLPEVIAMDMKVTCILEGLSQNAASTSTQSPELAELRGYLQNRESLLAIASNIVLFNSIQHLLSLFRELSSMEDDSMESLTNSCKCVVSMLRGHVDTNREKQEILKKQLQGHPIVGIFPRIIECFQTLNIVFPEFGEKVLAIIK